ncbi:MAG: hypothetical protein M3548_01825 [Actinomycetota bacterium]|nr:hypothetical protein [Actinomycetota bacterium]
MTASCDKPAFLAASRGSAALSGPRAVRELVSVALDLITDAINPSMHSWDQAPGASVIERRLTDEVARTARQQVPVVTGQR